MIGWRQVGILTLDSFLFILPYYCKETHSSASGLRLRSTDKCDLLVRRMKTRFAGFGDRALSAAGPRCWNNLPAALRAADSIDSFKTGLKTYLFSNAYSAVS